MGIEKSNKNHYQYRATCLMHKEDGKEEIKKIDLNTDILHLHFWNKLYNIRKCHKYLYDIAIQDKQVIRCKIIHEELILNTHTDKSSAQAQNNRKLVIGKILLILEMILLTAFSITQTSMAIELLKK